MLEGGETRPRVQRGEFADVYGHRTGHGDGPSDQRKLVKLNVARFRAPADVLCESEGIGDINGQTAGRKRSRERGGVSCKEDAGQERQRAAATEKSAGTEVRPPQPGLPAGLRRATSIGPYSPRKSRKPPIHSRAEIS
jgi:hypothetical protein